MKLMAKLKRIRYENTESILHQGQLVLHRRAGPLAVQP
jgi:hypothetical protein